MMRILKAAGIHMWLATLAAVPAAFFLAPVIFSVFPGAYPIAPVMIIFLILFTGISLLTNTVAAGMVERFITEGQAWERSGIAGKAQGAYMKALRIYEGFLFLPFLSGPAAEKLVSTIAGFNIHADTDNPNFSLAVADYLRHHPEDEGIAIPWLRRLKKSQLVSAADQEVLSALSDSGCSSPRMSELLADILISLDRKDFVARKFYDQLKRMPDLGQRYAGPLENLVGETAAGTLGQDRLIVQPRETVKQKRSGTGRLAAARTKQGLKRAGQAVSIVWSYIAGGIRAAKKAAAWAKETEKILFYLKTGIVGMAALGLLIFMVSTVVHLTRPEVVDNRSQSSAVPVPKPFTIQVAAYLKQSHAQRYAETLNNKGVQAHIKKVDAGGKTWYLVRVSEFVDKKSAAAFGQKLKQENIIEDFFVNNK